MPPPFQSSLLRHWQNIRTIMQCFSISLFSFFFLAMISYRVFSKDVKASVKVLHMTIQIFAFVFGVVGIHAAVEYHSTNGIADLYTLHSWVGITSFVLFSCQVYQYLQYSAIIDQDSDSRLEPLGNKTKILLF